MLSFIIYGFACIFIKSVFSYSGIYVLVLFCYLGLFSFRLKFLFY